jgi:hypothetical protein
MHDFTIKLFLIKSNVQHNVNVKRNLAELVGNELMRVKTIHA